MTAVDIDNVLLSVGMGRYQFVGCVLFGLMIMYSNVSSVTYVFTAGDLKYRYVRSFLNKKYVLSILNRSIRMGGWGGGGYDKPEIE